MNQFRKRGALLSVVGGLAGMIAVIVISPPDLRLELVARVGATLAAVGVALALSYLFVKGNIMAEKTLDAAPCARDPQEVEVIKALADAHNALEGDWNNNRQSNFGKLLIERDLALQALLGYYLRAGVIDKVEIIRSKRIPPPAQTVNEVPWDGK